jgi:antitoxin component YwqK of YwqJK toxin-antitoxin module
VLVLVLVVLIAIAASGCGGDVEYWPDGVRRAQGRIAFHTEGRAEARVERETGPWTWWFQNGERREAGTLEHGRRTGTWTQWYPNGQRRSQGLRVWDEESRASVREGVWTFWHENGERSAAGVYETGRREGHWDYTLDDGSLDGDRTGEYHDDQRIE